VRAGWRIRRMTARIRIGAMRWAARMPWAMPALQLRGDKGREIDDMTEAEKAEEVHAALKTAVTAPPEVALPLLNGLAGLVQSDGDDRPIEVDEARAAAFMAICEVGKALHRGQPVGPLWEAAINATQHWKMLVQ
jgi:hypothetical protein